MITVVCTLWGNWPDGTGRGIEYVNKLFRGIRRNTALEYGKEWDFSLIVDLNTAREVVKVEPQIRVYSNRIAAFRGNLPKLAVLDPANGFGGQVIVFDLDNIIIGNVDDFLTWRGRLCVRGRFENPAEPDGDVISFDAAEGAKWWDALMSNPVLFETMTQGRERVFYNIVAPGAEIWQRQLPDQIVSYKRHVRGPGLPAGARVVSCHGRPHPHEIDEPWMDWNWR